MKLASADSSSALIFTNTTDRSAAHQPALAEQSLDLVDVLLSWSGSASPPTDIAAAPTTPALGVDGEHLGGRPQGGQHPRGVALARDGDDRVGARGRG